MRIIVLILFLFMSFYSFLLSQDLSDIKEDRLRKGQVEDYYLKKYEDIDTYMLIKTSIPSSLFISDTLLIVSYLDREGTFLYNFWGSKQDSIIEIHSNNESYLSSKQVVQKNYIVNEIIQGRLDGVLEKGKCDTIISTHPVFLRILIALRRGENYKIESYTIHSFFPPDTK